MATPCFPRNHSFVGAHTSKGALPSSGASSSTVKTKCASVYCGHVYNFAPTSHESALLHHVLHTGGSSLCYCPTRKHLHESANKVMLQLKKMCAEAKTEDAKARIRRRGDLLKTTVAEMMTRTSDRTSCYSEQLHMLQDVKDALAVAKSDDDEALAIATDDQLELVNYWNARMAANPTKVITVDDVTVKDVLHFKRWWIHQA